MQNIFQKVKPSITQTSEIYMFCSCPFIDIHHFGHQFTLCVSENVMSKLLGLNRIISCQISIILFSFNRPLRLSFFPQGIHVFQRGSMLYPLAIVHRWQTKKASSRHGYCFHPWKEKICFLYTSGPWENINVLLQGFAWMGNFPTWYIFH